ncbi:MAG: lipoprotein-releasing ABC transporter permease subunit [Gammaproteobacteria bacterium]|nr:lipoprotein-releasing ABC transporter permease subunit [Gammaproteobacteria bacterium]MCH9745053.1 lipoprotein-releasing ABC transporter permease subunit [Gammaproteobacteria bacterium]
MMKPLSFYIGLRYTRAKRRNRFVSFISLASILGIGLGVAVLITVLSVMNGFDYKIKALFFTMQPQVTVTTQQPIHDNWRMLANKINLLHEVTASAPYVNGKGMLINAGQLYGVQVLGILPKQESKVSDISKNMIAGKLDSLKPGKFNIILGETLADNLAVHVGDKVNLYTPQANITPLGAFPTFKAFTVSGIFHAGDSFGFDSGVTFIDLSDAAKLFPPEYGMRGLHIKIRDIYDANKVGADIAQLLPPVYAVTNWTDTAGAFFQALQMEKTILFVILLLIIAVAVFNLVSSLVMIVNDKRSDIAVLRTLGATPGMVMRIFIIQGSIVGVAGTLLGLGFGLLLAEYVTPITNWVQKIFHVQFVRSSVYFLNYLPSRIETSDVVIVCILAIVLSVLATLYPARVASRTEPAEALRYE